MISALGSRRRRLLHAFAATMPFLILCAPVLGADETSPGFALKNGDRIVLLGNGVIEQERTHGHIETLLVSRDPTAAITVLNLGWGGDTVGGIARTAGYQHPDGLARLLKEVQDAKPNIILLGYGMNESFDGDRGLDGFLKDYENLLTKLEPLKARVVVLSPTYHEDLGPPLPDPTEHNRTLKAYTSGLRKLAAQRGHAFVDLFQPLRLAKQVDRKRKLTTNGVHLTDAGHAIVARAIATQLHLVPYAWRVELDKSGNVTTCKGVIVDKIGSGVFPALDPAFPPVGTHGGVLPIGRGDTQELRVTGLPAGEYALNVDGKDLLRVTADQLQKGLRLTDGPVMRDYEKLRAAIVRKNELFYRRWRPFNDHSRHWDFMKGDYALYDKAIADQERAIAGLRGPAPHVYAITKVGGTK
jgi:lysophospholipase L1-like esterase